jgi:hypothetical protein
MLSKRPITRRLLFPAIFFGLNLLCFMGGAHRRHIQHHTRGSCQRGSQGAGRVGSRNEWSGSVITYDWLIDHIHAPPVHAPPIHAAREGPSSTSHTALILVAAVMLHPTMKVELLAQVNVLALGSAPRAPGLARGPPVS